MSIHQTIKQENSIKQKNYHLKIRMNNNCYKETILELCVSLRNNNFTGYEGAIAERYYAHHNGNRAEGCVTCDLALCSRMVFCCWSRGLILMLAKLENS